MFLWKLICSNWFVSKSCWVGLNLGDREAPKASLRMIIGEFMPVVVCFRLPLLSKAVFALVSSWSLYISLILQEKLKNTQVGKQEGMVGAEIQAALSLSNSYVNGLNSDSASGNVHWESENHEKSDSRTKHHQLKTSFRADAVAAG